MTESECPDVDYCQQSISSLNVVQKLAKNLKVQLNVRQCQYLADKLTEMGCFLRAKSDNLVQIRDSADIRRKALLQLHLAVKRAEKLVRGCCCEEESWLEAAVTLSHVKEDIKDILLDLRWWMSMLDIAIASVTWRSSGQRILLELLQSADEDYGKLRRELHAHHNSLDRAASEDEETLLRKVREVEASFAGGGRTAEQKHVYLLAVHVRSRLENSEVETVDDLNEYDEGILIGMGGFGAVQNVRWMGRRCALKTLRQACKKEATSLRAFQHPHIVKFFRYWEAPFQNTPTGLPRGTPQGTPVSDSGQLYRGSLQSHILMELLPMDLSQHLTKLRNMANFTVGSKRRPEHTRGVLLSEDVALDFMLQIVKAMWYLNSREVAHRDLKPNNVLVRPVSDDEVPELNYRGYMRAKLADFGMAKTKAMSSALTTQPMNLGTRMYGAPEVFNKEIISEKKYPRKADVWSLGIMFCEVLTGDIPFPGVADGTLRLDSLQKKIVKGLRPKLPENCPDYLKFIIESCWQLRSEDRPTFEDLWRLMRIAQVQSLGLIQKDHDLFYYKARTGLKSLRPLKRITSSVPSPGPLPKPEDVPGRPGTSIWWMKLRWMSYNLARKRDLSFQPLSTLSRRLSRASEVPASLYSSDRKSLGHLVNQVGPRIMDVSESKLDVIFFEGNVGMTKGLSCKDTWVQRNNPNVWWPRDWVPKDLGDDIRVLLLEYSISDDGVEGVLDQLQTLLVFNERWNRKHTWERPIVLVGHSLGCVVIEHLVVALEKRAKSIETLDDEVEIGRAKVAEAFLTSLAGCFFYAPPWRGLVSSEDLLKHVFGGLTYSRELFSDLCLDSPKLKLLSEEFVRVKRKHLKLTAAIEGSHTGGRTVVPPASVLGFDGMVVELQESNHRDVCKPTDKQHLAYKEVLKFVADVLESSKAIRDAVDDKAQYFSADEQQKLSSGKQQYSSHFKQQDLSCGKMEYLFSGKEQDLSTGNRTEGSGLVHWQVLENSKVDEQGIVVDQVWPLENSVACERTKFNIIFFEGNVGEKEFTCIKDSWIQRGVSGVCWPQDWLPFDLGADVRILLLKYRISDYLGLEGVVSALQKKLILSDAWNQNQEWENPIVMVGHSLGCVIIQNLVVRLYHDSMKMEAKTSKAFFKNLRGCYFYAPPLNGFVPSESVLRVVFGGLEFSTDLFWHFSEGSPEIRKLFQDFILIIMGSQISIKILLEGKKSGEEMVVVAPKELTEFVLLDSNHSEVCQPISRDHESYKDFLDFMANILQNQGSSKLSSCREAKSDKSGVSFKDSDRDESFEFVEIPDDSFGDYHPLSSSMERPSYMPSSLNLNSCHQVKSYMSNESGKDSNKDESSMFVKTPGDSFGVDPQLSTPGIECSSHLSNENEELSDMLKQKINEIDNVAETQVNDVSESEVLIICNHNEEDDTLVFHFLDGQSMAKVVGVGLDYAKVILRNGLDIEVEEVTEPSWESAWSHSKSMENTLYKTMKVKVPLHNGIKPTRAFDQDDRHDIAMTRPLLWDVARYFTMQKILATLCNGDADQSRKDGPGQGSGSGNSNDVKSRTTLLFYAFRSWFSMHFVKRGNRKDDDENGAFGQSGSEKVDFNGSHAKVKVSLMATGYKFKNCYPGDFGVRIVEKSKDLEIKCDLDLEFFKNELGKKISLMAHIKFGIYEHPSREDTSGNSIDDLDIEIVEGNRYGAFHDEISTRFCAENPSSIGINTDVEAHGCNQGKILHTEERAKSKGKGKEVVGSISVGGNVVGASMNGGVSVKRSSSVQNSHTTSITSEYISNFSEGGFHVQKVIREGSMEFRFLAPHLSIEDPALFWESRDYRNAKRALPAFQDQDVQFSGSWEVRSDEKLAKYHVQAVRYFGEFMRTSVNVASASSSIFFRKPNSKQEVSYKKLMYQQVYTKALYLNHEMTHWVDYQLSEKVVDHLTTPSNDPCPLVRLNPSSNSL